MRICFATKKDLTKLKKYFSFYNDKEYSVARIKYFLDYGKTVVAKEGKEILGLMQWHIKENPKHGLAEVEEVFVYKNHRGKGIANEILRFVIDSIKKEFERKGIVPRKIFLFVLEKNTAARKLYEKAGFRKVCSVGDLFEKGKKDLLYVFEF